MAKKIMMAISDSSAPRRKISMRKFYLSRFCSKLFLLKKHVVQRRHRVKQRHKKISPAPAGHRPCVGCVTFIAIAMSRQFSQRRQHDCGNGDDQNSHQKKTSKKFSALFRAVKKF